MESTMDLIFGLKIGLKLGDWFKKN
jgi:hypothetical protein